ncbi:hypothetical protein EDD18DRAFT_1088887, partial [Armillaria luteobubalina]
TDESCRNYISEHYFWFLWTYDGCRFPIQRTDVIRYFVLLTEVYTTMSILAGMSIRPLLTYPVILPKVILVSISNGLLFSIKGHSFSTQLFPNLATFYHS